MKLNTIITCLLIAPTLFLTACSSLNSDFECSMKPGVRCESLDQVDAQVDSGEIGRPLTTKVTYKEPSFHSNAPQTVLYKDADQTINHTPLRYREAVMRVWVAPYEDTAGNYHQESDIYTVVKPSHWIDYPPNESTIKED